jgi:hypothetical protein
MNVKLMNEQQQKALVAMHGFVEAMAQEGLSLVDCLGVLAVVEHDLRVMLNAMARQVAEQRGPLITVPHLRMKNQGLEPGGNGHADHR